MLGPKGHVQVNAFSTETKLVTIFFIWLRCSEKKRRDSSISPLVLCKKMLMSNISLLFLSFRSINTLTNFLVSIMTSIVFFGKSSGSACLFFPFRSINTLTNYTCFHPDKLHQHTSCRLIV
jgi:hypothetical protein